MSTPRHRWFFAGRWRDPNGFDYYEWGQKIIEGKGATRILVAQNTYRHPVESFWP
jgi:hypothetical protein